MALGRVQSGDVSWDPLWTEIRLGTDKYMREQSTLKDQLCYVTEKDTVLLKTRGSRMRPVGPDPDPGIAQKEPRYEISLHEPTDYQSVFEATRRAIDLGYDAEQLRGEWTQILRSDNELVTNTVINSMLTAGGFWNADAVPPPYKNNVFAGAHDHYLASNELAGGVGVPTFAILNRLKHTVLEHGFDSGTRIVCLMNGTNAETVENTAAWDNIPGPMPTPLLSDLQRTGMSPQWETNGMWVTVNDWVPLDYLLAFAVPTGAVNRICAWRLPAAGHPRTANATPYRQSEQDGVIEEIWRLVRWCSSTVVDRDAGAAYYLGADVWADYDFALNAG